MPRYEGLTFTCYLKRQIYPETWFHDLFQALWEHGLDFTVPGHEASDSAQIATWGEALQQPAKTFFAGVGHIPSLEVLPLERVAERLGNGVSGGMDIKDKDLEEMDLFFDLFPLPPEQTVSPFNALGKVALHVSGIYSWTNFVPEVPGTAGLILPYQQTWLAFLHWSQILCSLVSPLYGAGYAIDYEESLSISTKVEAAVSNALEQGNLPDLRTILRGGGCQYIPPDRINPDLLNRLLEQPGYTIGRLTNHGLFSVPTYFPFQYEHNEVYRQIALGKKAHEKKAGSKQVAVHYQRAQGILEQLHQERIVFPPPLHRLAEANDWEAKMMVGGELARLLHQEQAEKRPEEE